MTIRNILLATDLSVRCDRALERAVKLATEYSAHMIVAHALQQVVSPDDQALWRRPVDPLEFARKKVRADVSGHNDVVTDVLVEQAEPADMMVRAAKRLDCDLIVTGMARNEALGRMALGNTVDTVVRQIDVPVLVVKSRPHDAYRNIVVATDFSEGARSALETTLVMFPNEQIILFHAFDVHYEAFITDKTAARDAAHHHAMESSRNFIEASDIDAGAKSRILPVCQYGYTGALLNDLVLDGGADLVVLGTEGRTGLAAFLLGSTAQRLATELPVDVLLIRRRRNLTAGS
ncbi:MAG: universal stress protein [Pseudomonadota bacterium]